MIAGTWVWDDGGHRQVPDWHVELGDCQRSGTGLVWVSLDDPDPDELQRLATQLSLHPLAVEDAIAGKQRPKIDRYGDALLVVLRPVEYDAATRQVETRELTVFIGPHYVVTVRRGGRTALRDVRYRLDSAPVELRASPAGGLYEVLDVVVDRCVEVADALGQELDSLEEQVFKGSRGTDAAAIYALKREVQEVRRSVAPLVDPLTELARQDVPQVPAAARPFFADVLDHAVRTAEHVEAFERSLTDILNVHLAQVSVRQNDDVRKISSWAAIAAAPTLVASIYGMNFSNMPELDWHYGYVWALGLIFAVSGGLFRAFKRSGWL